jgi:hypothetical protein
MVYQVVALVAVNVNHHAHTAGIVLVVWPIEPPFSCRLLTFCHIILTLSIILRAKLAILLTIWSQISIISINVSSKDYHQESFLAKKKQTVSILRLFAFKS